jgi:hypothetical protein
MSRSTKNLLSLDVSSCSVVVTCKACPWWHGFAFSRGEGWERAANHEKLVHEGFVGAQNALAKHRERERDAINRRAIAMAASQTRRALDEYVMKAIANQD